MSFAKRHPFLFVCLCVLIAVSAPILLPLLIFCVILIIGSIPVDYDFVLPADQIAYIAIVYEDTDAPIFDISDQRITVYAELDPDQFDDFMEDFERVTVYRGAYDGFPTHGGPSIRITYADGTREIISLKGSYCYPPGESTQPSENRHKFEDSRRFTFFDLLEKYGFPEQE